MINRYGKSNAKHDAHTFYMLAKTLLKRDPDASPCICYHARGFIFLQHAWERKQYPAAQCIFNRDALVDLIDNYQPAAALCIISETLEYIMLEKNIFNA